MVARRESAAVLLADGGAFVAKLHATVHAAHRLAFCRAFAADRGARLAGFDAIQDFFWGGHVGFSWTTHFAPIQ